MSIANIATGELVDRVLDALDEMPVGTIRGKNPFTGPLATVQQISAVIGMSDSATRAAIHRARRAGLVRVWDGLDPTIGHRRLYVTGVA